MRWRSESTIVFVLCAVSAFIFQNCGDPFAAAQFAPQSLSSAEPPEVEAIPQPNPPVAANVVPTLAAWSDDVYPEPKKMSDCLSNPEVNLCLVRKDPLSSAGVAQFAPAFTPGTAAQANAGTQTQQANVFVYGVKVPLDSAFSNAHFRLLKSPNVTNDVRIRPTEQDWKHSFASDLDTAQNAQLNLWYWANRQRSYFTEKTSKWYFSNRAASIIAYDAGTENNAYFSSANNQIVLGYSVVNANGGRQPLALDVGVVVHELGHANLAGASNVSGFGGTRCPNKNGCMGAIHEGVGDIHNFIMFPEFAGDIGAYFMNRIAGLRNSGTAKSRTAQQWYERSQNPGEIHDMGNVYASIWYEVWRAAKAKAEEKDIEILFSAHLVGFTRNDNFTTALTSIKAQANQLLNATKAAAVIAAFETEYQRAGVDLQ